MRFGSDANGALQVYRGDGNGNYLVAALGSPTANGTIAAGAWYGMAMQVTFNGSSGSFVLYINGSATPALNLSGLNTAPSGNNYASQVHIGNKANAAYGGSRYDDFYCLDTTGGFLNALVGTDSRIITKVPSGAGNYTNWSPVGMASNWQNVSQQPPNTSDYNANNVGGTKDSYALPSISLGTAPYAVIAQASLEKDDGATHVPSLLVRSGSTDGVGAALPALTSGYLFYQTVFQNDPATSAAWTGPGADAAQVGIEEN
jgi:hypothetical protein